MKRFQSREKRATAIPNLRVVDFTRVLAGPYASRILADYGAEVIKIQPLAALEEEDPNLSGYFNMWNRNKLSITLNLNKPQGIHLAKRLIMLSDIVMENFSPRVMKNWGLDYGSLEKTRPDLIMVSMSGLGQTGIWKDFVAYGPTIQALSGLTYLTTFPGQSPKGMGYSYADHVAGLMAALAVLLALEYRYQTGKGQYIDLSELEALSTLLGVAFLDYTINHRPIAPAGNSSPCRQAAPHGVYRCKGRDRWCAIAVFTDEEWRSFCNVLGNPRWATKKRFATVPERLRHSHELDKLVEEWTLGYGAEEVMTRLQQAGIAAGVVQDAADLAQDAQLNSRGFFTELEHPILGRTLQDTSPLKLSETPAQFQRTAPLLGQDNNYVYGQLLGLTAAEISQLQQQGVIAQASW